MYHVPVLKWGYFGTSILFVSTEIGLFGARLMRLTVMGDAAGAEALYKRALEVPRNITLKSETRSLKIRYPKPEA